MNPISWIRTNVARLTSLKDPPHTIALGVAIGMFFGLIPLWGLKTLLAIGVDAVAARQHCGGSDCRDIARHSPALGALASQVGIRCGLLALEPSTRSPAKVAHVPSKPDNLVPLVDLFYHRSAIAAWLVGCGGPRFHRHLFSHPRGGRKVAAQESFVTRRLRRGSLNELSARDSALRIPAARFDQVGGMRTSRCRRTLLSRGSGICFAFRKNDITQPAFIAVDTPRWRLDTSPKL